MHVQYSDSKPSTFWYENKLIQRHADRILYHSMVMKYSLGWSENGYIVTVPYNIILSIAPAQTLLHNYYDTLSSPNHATESLVHTSIQYTEPVIEMVDVYSTWATHSFL